MVNRGVSGSHGHRGRARRLRGRVAARRAGVPVRLIEMRPERSTPVHKTGNVAELVCSNSFKSVDPETAAGSLKYELSVLSSKLLACAFDTRVAAGGALAVDRNEFSAAVQRLIEQRLTSSSYARGARAFLKVRPSSRLARSLPMRLPSQLAVELGSRSCVLRRGSPHRRGRFD